MKTINLEILTPFGRYFSGEVEYLEVRSDKSVLGIYPGHAPLVSTLIISPMHIKMDGQVLNYAISGGVIHIKKDNHVILLLDSVEREDEIDYIRAQESRKRAEERLNHIDENVDVKRAKYSLARALNRLRLINKD